MKALILAFLALLSLSSIVAAEHSDLQSASSLEELSKWTFQINRPLTLEEKGDIRNKCDQALRGQ